jgi:pimeloyl-ACP methyl ester carboxylesterase
VYKPYGWQSDVQWRRMAESSVRRLPDGRITAHYDPAMVRQFIVHPNDYELWDAFETLDMPTLLLRGEDSDLLSPQTAQAMTERGPKAQLAVIPGCGHAPCLNVPEHIDLIRTFLAT